MAIRLAENAQSKSPGSRNLQQVVRKSLLKKVGADHV